jgi:sugar lactone lactonase YvrE
MTAQRLALLIATDAYADPAFQQLRAPRADIDALASVLADPDIGGYEVRTSLNRPTHAVALAIEDLFAETGLGDVALLYFSGHGIKDARGDLYLATATSRHDRLASTTVAAAFVRHEMHYSRCRRILVWLDCCYAGAFPPDVRHRSGGIDVLAQLGGRGTAVMTASTALEYAFETGGDAATRIAVTAAPSVFTGVLTEGLRTGDADLDQDGSVDVTELYEYVYHRVRVASPQQTPTLDSRIEGKLHVAASPRGRLPRACLPPEVTQAARSPLPSVRLAVIGDLTALAGQHPRTATGAVIETLHDLAADQDQRVAAQARSALSYLNHQTIPAPVTGEQAAGTEPPAAPVLDRPVQEDAQDRPGREDREPAAGDDSGRLTRRRRSWPRRTAESAVAVLLVTCLPGSGAGLTRPGSPAAPSAVSRTPHTTPPSASRPVQLIAALPGASAGEFGTALTFSRDGRLLATATGNSAQVWNVASHRLVATADLAGTVRGVAFSRDGKELVIADYANFAAIFDIASRKLVHNFSETGQAMNAAAVSPDGSMIATGGDTTSVSLWNASGSQQIGSVPIEGQIFSLAFSPDGRTLAVDNSNVTLWNVVSAGNVFKIATLGASQVAIQGMAFSPDGRMLATVMPSSGVTLWNVATHKQGATWPDPNGPEGIAFSPDGRTLAVSDSTELTLLDLSSLKPVDIFQGGQGAPAFSPDGRMLASAGNGAVDLWNTNWLLTRR